MTKATVGVIVILLVLAGVVFFITKGTPVQDQPVATQPVARLTIAEASQPVFALLYIAETKGYFAEEGLQVEYKTFTSGRDALTSVIEGEADLATVFETPVVIKSYEGYDLAIISGLHSSNHNTALVARTDKGIYAFQDLVDKRVAVTKNSNGEFFLFQLLSSYGISPEDVIFVDTRPQDMSGALKSGSVDAVVTWNPHLFVIRRSFSEDQVLTFFSDEYTELSVLAGRREYVTAHPDTMRRLLRALIKAEGFTEQHNREAQQITIDWLSEQSGSTIRAIWDDAQRSLRVDEVLLNTLRGEGHWLGEAGVVSGPMPDFKRMLYTQYLEEVNLHAAGL